jgi:3,4-dihydroxy 2-butanone 4-phosphate synthase/GTP cyclohydrolase II
MTMDLVHAAVAAIAAGRPVVVADDPSRENEGDLIFAAAHATPKLVAFTVRHTSGFVCVALPGEDCDRLALPPMHHRDDDPFGTAYRVTVDLRGTGTGISATDRARTIVALASPGSTPHDFTRPGHVVPLLARDGGVLSRPGHTEAAVDLARLAGLPAAGALCEIVSQDRPGHMARGAELARFAAEHDLVHLSIADLVAFRQRTETQVRRAAATSLPTSYGRFEAIGYEGRYDSAQHIALLAGPIGDNVPVYVHTECLTGDVMRSAACRCGRDLDDAMKRFAAQGRGVIVYLRPPGLPRACALFGDTTGTDGIAQWILDDLGVQPAPRLIAV